MVKQARLTLAILGVGAGLSARSVGADTILEQMQNEVAGVAGKARACVVSIEDARAIVVSYNNSALEKTDLQNQLLHVQVDRAAAAVEAAAAEERYRAGLTTALEVEKPRRDLARLDTRLAYIQQTLANFGREDMSSQQKRELDARIAELEVDQKFSAEQVKILQQQFAVGTTTNENLQAAQQEAAHIRLNLTAAQAQRKVWKPLAQDSAFISWGSLAPPTPKSGSGFSVGDGYIVTTADVVQGMSSPIVTADDGRRIRAILVAIDGERNVGLVRLSSSARLPGLTLGDSDRVMPGHFAISIGNQAGQYNSVALGIISGIRAQGLYSGMHFYPTLIQVDGATGAGTSGAPILNARGEVIGMIAAALAPSSTPSASSGYVDPTQQMQTFHFAPSLPRNASPPSDRNVNRGQSTPQSRSTNDSGGANVFVPTPSFNWQALNWQTSSRMLLNTQPTPNETAPRPMPAGSGTGFAIPINAMKGVIEELKAGKDIVHVWLGVALDDVDNAQEENGVIHLNTQARIRGIYVNSPAAKMGMQSGDVIVSLEGKPVHATSDVRAMILPKKAGQKVVAGIQRGAKTLTFTVTLETQPTLRPGLIPPGTEQILQNGPVFQLNGSVSHEKKKTPAKP